MDCSIVRKAPWAAFVVGALAFAGRARADDPPAIVTEHSTRTTAARARYQAGVAAYTARRYADAIELFLDANRIEPSAALSFDVARSYDKLGQTSNALAWYRDYLRRAPNAKDRADVEEKHVKPLERRLSQSGVQQLTVSSTPRGAELVVDGSAVGVTPWTGDLPPGEHRLVARLEGFTNAERHVALSADVASDVVLPLARPPSVGFVEPPPTSTIIANPIHQSADRLPASNRARGSPVRTAGWIIVGAGAGSLGTAVVFEALRRSAETAAENDPTQLGYADKFKTMESRQTAARVFAGTGAVLTLSGIVLVLAGGSHSGAPETDVTFDWSASRVGARLRGSF